MTRIQANEYCIVGQLVAKNQATAPHAQLDLRYEQRINNAEVVGRS